MHTDTQALPLTVYIALIAFKLALKTGCWRCCRAVAQHNVLRLLCATCSCGSHRVESTDLFAIFVDMPVTLGRQ